MEKIKARFLTPISNENEKAYIKTEGYSLKYVTFDEETTKRLLEEASCYEVCDFNIYIFANDVVDEKTKQIRTYGTEVPKLTSISSPMYSTDELPLADMLIIDGHFAGVVVKVVQEGGNGWSNYRREYYPILFIDGKVLGTTEAHYSYSGEDYDREITNNYSLHKIK